MEDVAIFWDYENCPLPASASGYTIVNNIRCMAQSYGSIKSLRAYLGITEQLVLRTLALRSELQSSGVSLVDCPHNGRKDVADKMIIVDMMAYAIDNPAPSTVILITGDRDFAYALSILRLRRYRVILATLPTAHASLTSQASICIDWLGEVLEPVQRSPNITAIKTERTSKLRAQPSRERAGENNYPPSRTSSSPQHVPQPMDFGSHSDQFGDPPHSPNQRKQFPHSSNSGRTFVPERNQAVETSQQLETPNTRPINTTFGPSGRHIHHSVSPLFTQTTSPPQTQRQTLLPSFMNKLSNVALSPDKIQNHGLSLDGNTEDMNQTTVDISAPAGEFDFMLPSLRPASAPGSLPSSSPTTNHGSPIPTQTPIQEFPSATLPEQTSSNKNIAPMENVAPPISNPPIIAMEKTKAVQQCSSPGVAVPTIPLARVPVPSKQISIIPPQQPAIRGPTVPPTTNSPVVPAIFRILVETLQSSKAKGLLRPLRSVLSLQIAKNGSTYKAAGVAKFSQYVALAEKQGIVEIGGSEGTAWIALKPEWYNASFSC